MNETLKHFYIYLIICLTGRRKGEEGGGRGRKGEEGVVQVVAVRV